MIKIFATALLAAFSAMQAQAQAINISQKGDTTILTIPHSPKYLILPVEEDMPEAQVLLDNGRPTDTWMDVRLAQNATDYEVPFALNEGKTSVVKLLNVKADALALKPGTMRLSNEWSVKNTDFYRPAYHHTPPYGWMNDPNGMFFKDGVYHLCFQYNPYGSKWGNMHWGHAVSSDMVHWKHVEPTLARDPMGHIFSGSAVVDKQGTAGYGKDAVVALYTSASEKNGQIQCMAYSTDGGYHFTKYEGNPVLRPFDGLKDFRDPKVFWYEPSKLWFMIVSADKEMRFYSSPNLKDWTYVSAFGQGYGAQPNQFECPDFIQMPVEGQPGKKKWVMIVNINPGCLFGGSATEYFVGDFDGNKFTCDTPPNVAKFLDYGKDHYATVCFSNTGERTLALAWMSNWQYANITPIKQYRGANTLPRELKLFEKDGQYYLAADVAPEALALRQAERDVKVGAVSGSRIVNGINSSVDNAFELRMQVTPGKNGVAGVELFNDKGEKVQIYIDLKAKRLVMDRTQSGLVDFGNKAVPHDIEKAYDLHEHREKKEPMRKRNAVNYKNDFALGTWAPLSLCQGGTYSVDVWVDKCSIEIFVDGGRIAMTNLVFPTKPYTNARFFAKGAPAKFNGVKVCNVGL